MKRILLLVTAVMMATLSLRAQNDVQPYLTTEQLPDLIKCLPAPPAFDSPEFANDLVRYAWGKQQRTDPERAAIAKSDAVWEPIDTLFHLLSEPFGLEVTAENTPEIYTLLLTSLKTTDPMRKAPKAYYHRLRPFEYLADAMLTGEEAQLSGEGSYPSGHTMRGQTCALLMSQIAPERTEALMYRAYIYGESRVIAGAHWQSDVDASRVAASIAFCALQGNEDFMDQMAKAQQEYKEKTGQPVKHKCCKSKKNRNASSKRGK